LLAWAAAVAAPGTSVEQVTGLRGGGSPWLLRFSDGDEAVQRVGDARLAEDFATEAAALRHASAHGLPVPRLLGADLAGPVLAALPARTRPIESMDFAALRRGKPPRDLFVRAEECLARLPVPRTPPVFVHGDLWQGNTLWDGDRLTGIIDWDLVTAMATPVSMDWFVTAAQDQGRTDLDQPTMLARRDAFLLDALRRLEAFVRGG
jgi:aminoglycoside phosphotransferase